MQSIETKGIDELLDQWNSLLKQFPRMKADALERIGQSALTIVQREIQATGMKNGGGKLPGWQGYHIGSRLGYAAIRANGSKEGAVIGKNGPGAITNYTENGHKIRKPSQVKRDGYIYHPRIHETAVKGYHYYNQAGSPAEAAAQKEVEELVEAVGERLGGNSA